jgi:hypothetical protein
MVVACHLGSGQFIEYNLAASKPTFRREAA